MALVEEYYELNEAEEVTVSWKILQIAFYLFAACLGLWCGYTMALLRQRLEDKCYLFTSVKLQPSKEASNNSTNTNWEGDSWCDFCQYSMVSSFIVATIWATFFLMCGKGGKSLTGLPQPWRIVWPSLVFNLTYFIIALSTAINIQRGSEYFCWNQEFGRRLKTKSFLENCLPLKLILKKDYYIASLELDIVVKTSWGCAVSWLILFCISFFRIIFVIDFNLYKVCVFKLDETIQNKKEEILRVTNYEEPKTLRIREEQNRRFSYVEFEDKFEDLEEGKRAKLYPQSYNRSRTQPNAAFYVTADIRMLSREKKRKSSKSLDRAFGKNKPPFDVRKPIKIHSTVDDSEGSGTTPFFCRFYYEDEEEDIEWTPTKREKPEGFTEFWNESRSGSEIFLEDYATDQSLEFKKIM